LQPILKQKQIHLFPCCQFLYLVPWTLDRDTLTLTTCHVGTKGRQKRDRDTN
jgi:hypothetical protein